MALSFAIDTSKGETFDSAKSKRRQADMLAQSILGRAPKNVGEGLNSIGQAMIYRMLMNESGAAEQAGLASASDTMGSIFGGFPAPPSAAGGSSPVASADPSVSPNANVGSTIDFARGERGHGGSPYRDAIASIESAGSGDYSAVGPTHKTLGRALGRYQVMEANIGPWSKAALGREVTADEFLADKGIQDTIFDHRFGGYVKKFGNPQDAASAWFTGQPLAQGANKKDVLGTTGTAYVDKFNTAIGGQPAASPAAPVQVASLDPSIGMPNAGPVPSEYSSMGLTPDAWQRMNAPDGAQPAPALPAPRMVPDLPVAAPQPAPAPQQVAQAQDPSSLPVTAGGTAGALQPGQSSGPSLQQLLQAAQNPWLNDNQRQVVNMLLEQEMQKQDPMRQLQMQKLRQEVDSAGQPAPSDILAREKFDWERGQAGKIQPADAARLDLDRQKFEAEQKKLLELGAGTTVFDPATRQPVFTAPKETALPAGVQEYEYAKAQGFPGTFQDWEASKKGGMSLQVDPATGAVTFQQGSNIKPLTEGQSKDTTYATRAAGALPTLDQFGNALTSLPESAGGAVPGVGNYLKSPEYQQAEQAGLEFLQAILRKDTGAAITKDETHEYGRVYLPRPGDSPQVLEQKRVARQRALNALEAGMPPQGILAKEKALQKTDAAARPSTVINGYTIEQVED